MEQHSCPARLDPHGTGVHAEAARHRASGPAAKVVLPGQVEAWYITRADVMRALLADPRVSRNPRTSWPAYIRGEIPGDWELRFWVGVESMLTADGHGGEHTRLRRLVSAAFSPRRTEAWRPRIEAVTTGLLDGLAHRPPGAVADLRAEFAYQVPTRLICDLFGVPESDRPRMLRLLDAVLDTAAPAEQATRTAAELYGAVGDLVALRRAEPDGSMTSDLIAARDEDGSRLTEAELASTLILMIGAGAETTVNLIASLLLALLDDPGQLALLRSGQVPWPAAVEETLRHQGPVMGLPLRFATADIDLGDGVVISAGDPVMIAFGAAGRDPALHHDPDRFDLTRQDTSHLAFGHGIHFCLGAALARMEAVTAVPALLDRFPRLALTRPADQIPRLPSFIANGPAVLPVLLDPAA